MPAPLYVIRPCHPTGKDILYSAYTHFTKDKEEQHKLAAKDFAEQLGLICIFNNWAPEKEEDISWLSFTLGTGKEYMIFLAPPNFSL